MTPSIVAFESDGSIVVGDEARAVQRLGEANTVSLFKRSMGDDNFTFEFNGKHYSATDLSALVLRKLKAVAEEVLGKTVSQAVITVPAYFNNLQRNATVQAGRDAGLEVLRVINEPTAAAIAFGINKCNAKQTILVYDLGGGTFDVTLLEISAETIAVLATDGDHQLGGKDWDDRIAIFISDKFQNEFGGNPLDDIVTFNDLLIASETAKRTLTRTQKAVITVVHEGHKGKYEITRQEFESISTDLKGRTIELCENVLSEKGLHWKDLDGVLLVGGSTRMPMIEETVVKRSGKPIISSINVDEAVAIQQAAAKFEKNVFVNLFIKFSAPHQFAAELIKKSECGKLLGIRTYNKTAALWGDLSLQMNVATFHNHMMDFAIELAGMPEFVTASGIDYNDGKSIVISSFINDGIYTVMESNSTLPDGCAIEFEIGFELLCSGGCIRFDAIYGEYCNEEFSITKNGKPREVLSIDEVNDNEEVIKHIRYCLSKGIKSELIDIENATKTVRLMEMINKSLVE